MERFRSRISPRVSIKLTCKDKSLTEQHHKKECDINLIIKKYDKTGLINHVNKMDGIYDDVTGLDFIYAMQIVTNAQQGFEKMPSEIRNRFDNKPEALLDFVKNPENHDEAVKLGLVQKRPPTAPPAPPAAVKAPPTPPDEAPPPHPEA